MFAGSNATERMHSKQIWEYSYVTHFEHANVYFCNESESSLILTTFLCATSERVVHWERKQYHGFCALKSKKFCINNIDYETLKAQC